LLAGNNKYNGQLTLIVTFVYLLLDRSYLLLGGGTVPSILRCVVSNMNQLKKAVEKLSSRSYSE